MVCGFASFYEVDVVKLIRFVIRLGASNHDAQDIAQNAMLELHRDWDTVADPAGWVRTTAMRAYWRTMRWRHNEVVTEDLTSYPCGISSPEAFAEKAEFEREITAMLQDLPNQQRAIMALMRDSFTTDEIAQILSTTRRNVRVQTARARKTLKKARTSMLHHREGDR